MEKKNKISILLGVIILLLIIFGLPYIIPKRNKYTYLCFSKSVSEDQIIYVNMLKECGTSKKLENNILTKEKLDSYGIKLLDKYDDNQTTYYIKENKKANEQISIEDIYWKLEELTNKGITSHNGTKYTLYVNYNNFLIAEYHDHNEHVPLFTEEKVKSFVIRSYCCTGNFRLIILTENNNVYMSNEDVMDLISSSDTAIKSLTFKKLNLTNIQSFISINNGTSLGKTDVYAIDKNGIKYILEEPEISTSNQLNNELLSNISVFYKEGEHWYCDDACTILFDNSDEILTKENKESLDGTFATIESETQVIDNMTAHIYNINQIKEFFLGTFNKTFDESQIRDYFADDLKDDKYTFFESGPRINEIINTQTKDNYFIVETDYSIMTIQKENENYYIISNIKK